MNIPMDQPAPAPIPATQQADQQAPVLADQPAPAAEQTHVQPLNASYEININDYILDEGDSDSNYDYSNLINENLHNNSNPNSNNHYSDDEECISDDEIKNF
jgi:hypothetical protein